MKNPDCPCKRAKCPRFGDCDACRAHHADKKALPACDRLQKKAEKRAQKREKK